MIVTTLIIPRFPLASFQRQVRRDRLVERRVDDFGKQPYRSLLECGEVDGPGEQEQIILLTASSSNNLCSTASDERAERRRYSTPTLSIREGKKFPEFPDESRPLGSQGQAASSRNVIKCSRG